MLQAIGKRRHEYCLMGEIISLSQFRKESISGSRSNRSTAKRLRYSLASSGQLDADVNRVQYISEFRGKRPESSDGEPGDA